MAISKELKEELIVDYPIFIENTRKFYNKEISVQDYKGLSGPFGSYAEKGADSGMSRWRFPGGVLDQDKIRFTANAIRRYDLKVPHFTTGQCIQFHNLDGETIIKLFAECHSHGIYNRGAGGDHPRNTAASPLLGLQKDEQWDFSPYVRALSEYVLTLIKGIKFPRKFKTAFSNGLENSAHVTFKDFGVLAHPEEKTFSVYVAGGLGPNPKMGVLVGDHIQPEEILYYVKTLALIFSEHGNYKNRSKARVRYLQDILGGPEALQDTFRKYLANVKDTEALTINPSEFMSSIVKRGKIDSTLQNPRVGEQKQEGLYYVSWHPFGGNPSKEQLLKVLEYVGSLDDEVQIRLSSEESLYIVNLTADEARQALAITEEGGINDFYKSVSCIGATICQVGLQDSSGLLIQIFDAVRNATHVNSDLLPKFHISGCPSSCGTHQIGTIGFHGAMKVVDKVPTPAFRVFRGGNETLGHEHFAEQIGTIISTEIPSFFVELGEILTSVNLSFADWISNHTADFDALVVKYE
ncbi:nitrite/sulfite reductase [Veillonella rodentium]|uniref:Sulfite reductase [ferredoxin] n=1 Tax=Veillonella rodentium TaxID=248315 RepID=A0A239YFD3_9FIRM|nr:nitrite/sulfite reductase [Veillonella rodentium]SNV57961.1 Sulfite reductase [ferredoxin] [Veillonella rodentium]